jgi:chorismate mutase-like protein
MTSNLQVLRQQLDDVDAQLVELLGRRFQICRRIAAVKQEQAIPMMQTDRIALVKQRTATLAAAHGVSEQFIGRLYDLIIGEACRLEDQIMTRG